VSPLTNDGVNDWKHLSDKLKEHENNVEHITNIEKLREISMLQKILNDLTILYIEKYRIKFIDVNTIASNLVSRNTRENCFVRPFKY